MTSDLTFQSVSITSGTQYGNITSYLADNRHRPKYVSFVYSGMTYYAYLYRDAPSNYAADFSNTAPTLVRILGTGTTFNVNNSDVTASVSNAKLWY